MKPKTSFHREILKHTRSLPDISPAQIRYVENNMFREFAYTTKSRLSWCSKCGHTWRLENNLTDSVCGTTCPSCHEKLEVLSTNKRVFRSNEYFSIMTVCKGHQVIRCFRVDLERRYKKQAAYKFTEVIQYWISEKGQNAVLARMRVSGTWYDRWCYDSHLELRRYDTYNSCLKCSLPYIRNRILPKLHLCGFNGNYYDIEPVKFLSLLLKYRPYETMLKQGDISTMKFMMDRVGNKINQYWPSMKICRRHGYHILDYTIWTDHIDLLRHFNKDIHSPKYICPEDLDKEHSRLVCKRTIEKEREEMLKKIQEAHKHEENYRKAKSKYFGLYFTDGTIEIRVLSSVAEFVKEGTLLKHCVYTNDYYKRPASLILTARLKSDPTIPVETIEISLNTFDVIQSRGYKNGTSSYHQAIIDLMKSGLPQIRAIAA